MLPSPIPLFPLPNVVLFPNVFLPLHIFEPRYRQMVHRALAADRMIGMVLLKPGFEGDYEGTPPIYDVGCAGSITHVERLPDGRFNIVLRGVEKFRVQREEARTDAVLYREAYVETLAERLTDDGRDTLRAQRAEIERRLAPLFTAARASSPLPEIMSDEDLVNALSQYLSLEPIEKQALLELAGPVERAAALLELIEMKMLQGQGLGDKGMVH
ncbi:MAG TPA: LON peptidase substrate-binding domain-containing protein [Vicinamibacterales bacterium]|nr:LON peptidase substrate-binding domain-containing protein [Vicinamibacterales bacterium]